MSEQPKPLWNPLQKDLQVDHDLAEFWQSMEQQRITLFEKALQRPIDNEIEATLYLITMLIALSGATAAKRSEMIERFNYDPELDCLAYLQRNQVAPIGFISEPLQEVLNAFPSFYEDLACDLGAFVELVIREDFVREALEHRELTNVQKVKRLRENWLLSATACFDNHVFSYIKAFGEWDVLPGVVDRIIKRSPFPSNGNRDRSTLETISHSPQARQDAIPNTVEGAWRNLMPLTALQESDVVHDVLKGSIDADHLQSKKNNKRRDGCTVRQFAQRVMRRIRSEWENDHEYMHQADHDTDKALSFHEAIDANCNIEEQIVSKQSATYLVSKLTKEEREMFEWIAEEKVSIAAIAERKGITPSAVYKRIRKTQMRLDSIK